MKFSPISCIPVVLLGLFSFLDATSIEKSEASKYNQHMVIYATTAALAGTLAVMFFFDMNEETQNAIRTFRHAPNNGTQILKWSAKNKSCYKGWCWTYCTGPAALLYGLGEWCYTTEGRTQDYNYVECRDFHDCNTEWNCAGPCSI